MDNHEEKDNALNRKPDSEDTPPNADIPLWLQGMDDAAPEETKPINTPEDTEAAWIREIDEHTSVSATEEKVSSTDGNDLGGNEFEVEIDPSIFEQTQPEFIDEGFPEKTLADEDFTAFDDQESTEEIEIQIDSENPIIDNLQPDNDTLTAVDGFVDISEADISEEPDEMMDALDDQPLRDGELPEWLQEMIAESEQELTESEADISEMPELMEDPQYDEQVIDEGKSLDEELFQQDEVESPEDIKEPDNDFGERITIAEEDTAPIALSMEDPIVMLTDGELPDNEDDVIAEDEELVEELEIEGLLLGEADELSTFESMQSIADSLLADDEISDAEMMSADIATDSDIAPVEEFSGSTEEIDEMAVEETTLEEEHAFDRVSQLIEDGQIETALPLITELVEDDDHLEELEELLRQKAENEPFESSEILETLGDIALKQQKPQDAIEAYAKAISILLKSEEVRDEID